MSYCDLKKLGLLLCATAWLSVAGEIGAWAASEPELANAGHLDAHGIATLAATRALDHLAAPGGIFLDQRYHIPLPSALTDAVSVLSKNYSGAMADALERSINQAAENTAAIGREKFLKAVSDTHLATIPQSLSRSPVTEALQAKLDTQLIAAVRPEVGISLDLAAVRAAAENATRRYETVAQAPFPQVDYPHYIATELVQRFFAAMADEEIKVRLFSPGATGAVGASLQR